MSVTAHCVRGTTSVSVTAVTSSELFSVLGQYESRFRYHEWQ